MGLARKGTSRIQVEGRDYRWVVSGNDGFLDLIIEQSEGKGQRLAVQFSYSIGDITPGLVAQVIREGLRSGWTPEERGKQLYVRWVDGTMNRVDQLTEWCEGIEE